MKLNIKKIGECHTLPTQAHSDDVGYDVVADVMEIVFNDDTRLIFTKPLGIDDLLLIQNRVLAGLVINYVAYKANFIAWLEDPNYHLEAVANSRITKTPLFMKNGIGIIDPSYRGQIEWRYGVKIDWNVVYKNYIPQVGEVCGQLVIRKSYHADVVEVGEVDETARGDGGFGSTEMKCH